MSSVEDVHVGLHVGKRIHANALEAEMRRNEKECACFVPY